MSRPNAFVRGWREYWYEPMPVARLDVLARVIAVVTVFYVLHADLWVLGHGWAPRSFEQPVQLARVLHLPSPTPAALSLLQVVLIAGSVWMFTRRAPRASGAVMFAAYTLWALWAFDWAKVDHDRLTVVVALFALAMTPRTGRAAEALTGWAIRLIQVTFVLAYPFSAWAKLRFGGLGWMNSATFARAIVRRGTVVGDVLTGVPGLLVVSQWAFVAFEIATVVLLVPKAPARLRYAALGGIVMLHAMTVAMIGISFLPHTVLILAFFPVERWFRTRTPNHPAPEERATGASAPLAAQ